jgi:DNA-binding SARP family transcriptional activator
MGTAGPCHAGPPLSRPGDRVFGLRGDTAWRRWLLVEFGLLGPLLVRDGAADLAVSAPRQRVLLAALLLKAGRVVGVDELAEALWADRPPRNAAGAIHTAVLRLRSTLGPAGAELVLTRPPGYLIDVGDEALDLLRFEVLAGSGQAAAAAGQWEQAAGALREALGLWRGEPLADVSSPLLRAREVPPLTERHLSVLASRIDADLNLGRHEEVAGELRQLAAAHPLRERFHAQLMLALYRAGRQAEALGAYQEARRLLAEELGVDPGPELRRLHQQILEADPVLMPSRSVTPAQLPGGVRHFVGRVPELRALDQLLETPGGPGTVVISAIDGAAGVGKTALAVRFAHQAAGRFPDGQLYVNLRGFGPSGPPVTAQEAVRGFLDALGVPTVSIPAGLEAQAGLYRSLLAGKRMLIVLDNAADAAHARPLLPGAGGCLVVVTSRRQLTSLVAAEGASLLTLGLLTVGEARDLLARLLGAERIEAEPASADELVRLCARLPLALSVVAARAAARPGFPLAALAGELRGAQSRLDALAAGDAASDVRAAFSWSYQQLTTPAARMFRLLGLHPGPDISVPAAASLAGVPPAQARRTLGELARVHLLTESAPGRFAWHDLLRDYAAEQASARDSAAGRHQAARRALDHYLHTAHSAAVLLNPARGSLDLAPPGPGARPEDIADHGQALAWFRAEHRVLLAAITWAAEAGFNDLAWQLPWTTVPFFDSQVFWGDWAASQRTALAAAQRLGDRRGQARVHRDLGAACTQQGDYAAAHAHLQSALDLFTELGDHADQARVHYGLAWALECQGEYRAALGHAFRSLRTFRAAGYRVGEARALNAVGWCEALLGDYQQALDHLGQALRLYRELGEQLGESTALDSLGLAHHRLGEYHEAVRCYSRAADLRAEVGNRFRQAETLSCLGDTHQSAGHREAARDAWLRALAILDDLRHPDAGRVRVKLAGLDAGPLAAPSEQART